MAHCKIKVGNYAKEPTIGEKLFDLLERKPEKYDVTFSVGPDKKLVKGLKIILEAASVTLEKKFEESWKVSGEEISLPQLDAEAFQLFIKLTILGTWSVASLQNLNSPPGMMLNVLSICREFEMKDAIKNLEVLVKTLLKSFNRYTHTEEFLKISRINLENVLLIDELPMAEKDVFDCARRWAVFQCESQELEATGENMRKILGPCLYHIRFPLMSNKDFTKVTRYKNLLTAGEIIDVYQFIGLENADKLAYDPTLMRFKTQRRTSQMETLLPTGCSILNLTKELLLVDIPPFVCDGEWSQISWIQCNRKIALHGLGFFGPINGDAFYDVIVELVGFTNGKNTFSTGKIKKRLFARKGKVFHFVFDQPIQNRADDGNEVDRSFNIYFSLEGPSTWSVVGFKHMESKLEVGGIQFRYNRKSKQIAEILFKKL